MKVSIPFCGAPVWDPQYVARDGQNNTQGLQGLYDILYQAIRRGCSSYEGLRSTANFPRGFDCYSSSKVFDLGYVERVLRAYHLKPQET